MIPAAKVKRRSALICLGLAAATLAAFWGALQCQFVNYDDPAYITSNPALQRGLSTPPLGLRRPLRPAIGIP